MYQVKGLHLEADTITLSASQKGWLNEFTDFETPKQSPQSA